MHGRIVALLLLLTLPAAAQNTPDGYIIRCTKGKQVSIQNVPCEPGWKQQGETGVYYAPRDTERARRELEAARREIARRNAAMRQSGHRSSPRRSPDHLDCRNARAYVDRVKREIGSQRLTRAKASELCQVERNACGWCR